MLREYFVRLSFVGLNSAFHAYDGSLPLFFSVCREFDSRVRPGTV